MHEIVKVQMKSAKDEKRSDYLHRWETNHKYIYEQNSKVCNQHDH